MRKAKLWLAGIGVAVVGAFGVGGVAADAWSPSLKGADEVVVATGETHTGALYASGEVVRIDGTVEGDVYCAAATVEITGTVNGDDHG